MAKYVQSVSKILESMVQVLMDPVNRFSKDQMAKLMPFTSDISQTVGEMSCNIAMLEGELSATKMYMSKDTPTTIESTLELVSEMEERKNRKNNVIIFDITETGGCPRWCSDTYGSPTVHETYLARKGLHTTEEEKGTCTHPIAMLMLETLNIPVQ
ncbi:uncharacterized protein LOC143922385 [Arctopsyche grandis]|uniref:uncharacterized protein LOC143922385 n=1 Tax=Arctopsyche grandis TaxID=121162 RepID=UPI00406D8506